MSYSPVIIGMVGHARSGKDSAYAALADSVERVAFADTVKRITHYAITEAYGATDSQTTYKTAPVSSQSPASATLRRAYQLMGTEFGRALDQEIWSRAGLREAQDLNDNGFDVIITDVRFTSEADALREAGAILVRVTRAKTDPPFDWWTRIKRFFGFAPKLHASEAEVPLIEADVTIANDGTFEEYCTAIRDLYESLTWTPNGRSSNATILPPSP